MNWLAFLSDPVFWDWARPAIAALLGAAVGGGATLLAQRASIKAERTKAADAWKQEQDSRARAGVHSDVRNLLEELTQVHREVQAASPSLTDYLKGTSWRPKWKQIWTDGRSLSIDVLAELVREEPARLALKRVIRILDNAVDISEGAFPGKVATPLRTISAEVSAAGILIVARYLRDESYSFPMDDAVLSALNDKVSEFDAWTVWEFERASERDQKYIDEHPEQVARMSAEFGLPLPETGQGTKGKPQT